MALTTEQRRANYKAQRSGGALTAKQRRRIRQAENKANRVAGTVRVSRLRKAYDRKEMLRNRYAARGLINAIRGDQLRPKYQAALRAAQTRASLEAAVES